MTRTVSATREEQNEKEIGTLSDRTVARRPLKMSVATPTFYPGSQVRSRYILNSRLQFLKGKSNI
eukprot:581496-Hanusia_phi.AAC.1